MRQLILVLMLACTACTSDAVPPATNPMPPKNAPPPAAATGDTLAQIRAQIGTASCTASSQCRTLAVGARPCGGPEAYLPYSTATTDEAALRALGDRYAAERKAQNAKSGMMSDCRAVVDPGATCVAGTCQAADPLVKEAR